MKTEGDNNQQLVPVLCTPEQGYIQGYADGIQDTEEKWQEKVRWKSFNEEMPKFPCSIEVKSKNNFAQAVHWVTQESYERSIKIFDLWRYNIDLPIGEK